MSKGDEVDESDKMLVDAAADGAANNGLTDKLVFKVYPERWWLLATVVLLNLANYSHWVAFPSVAKNAAKYYDQVKHFFNLLLNLIFILNFVLASLSFVVS